MKISTIEMVLRKKLGDWVASFNDEILSNDVLNHSIVSGGCITSMLLHEKVNDFDIYLTDKSVAKRLIEHYLEKCKEKLGSSILEGTGFSVENTEDGVVLKSCTLKNKGIISVEEEFQGDMNDLISDISEDQYKDINKLLLEKDTNKEKYRLKFITENAMSISDKIQVITRFIGTPEEIHRNFDFMHCTNYFDCGTGRLVLNKEATVSILTRNLVYIGSKFPVCSIFRTRKFIERGWTITAGQQLKIIMQTNSLNLSDPLILREQLIGVDYMYFQDLLVLVNEYSEKGLTVDFSIICEIIEKLN